MSGEFSPAWFLRNPHAQTVWGRLWRPRRLVPMRREVLITPDDDELVLDHVDAPVTASEPLHFLLLHGLEGSSRSVYMQGLLAIIARHGHAATAMNFRSCARDPRHINRMLANRRPRFYHSGETGDFDFTLRTLASRSPSSRFAAIGSSLGGNVLLKWLGEHPGQTTVRAAATLSVPYDLGAGARHLELSAAGRFYVSGFLRTLKKKVASLVARFPETRNVIDVERAMRARTFWEFDDAATGPLHGFRDAADYYAQSSSIAFVGKITTPTLCISAVDDPFVPAVVLERLAAAKSPAVELRLPSCGGHVGFISGMLPWRCEYWAEELAVRWVMEHAA
ncbi:MAG TPA: alpha/beta fold hydrolase [Thermoanaerobaculia bacterium]|nr:alpha/beta fold hydrolase [Thermoanaerobaculia bacterium]